MRPGSPSTLLSLLALVVVLGAALPATGAPATAPSPATSDAALQTGDDLVTEGTTLELQLRADGDAVWTLSLRYRLADGNDTRGFTRLADSFESGEIELDYLESMRTARRASSQYTGRDMAFRNVTRSSEVRTDPETNRTVGVLELSFRWTNFGRPQGATVAVDDAFRTGPNSTWLSGIAPGQTFVVRPPEGYGVDTAPTGSRDGVLRWDEPTTFEPGYLEIRYQQLATSTRTSPPTTDPGSPGPGSESPTPVGPGGDSSTLLILGGLVGLGALAAAVLVLGRRREGTGDAVGGDSTGDGGNTPPADPSASDATGGSTPDTDGGAGTETTGNGVDLSLLSDEERVEYLLEQNGGRMRQANIVKETGWSNAKVSQLLSGMDQAGRVKKLRIGRENLISLPGEDIGEFDDGED